MEHYRKFLTPAEPALMLGLSKHHLLRSTLRRIRFGHRTIRFNIDDIVEFVRQATTAGCATQAVVLRSPMDAATNQAHGVLPP